MKKLITLVAVVATVSAMARPGNESKFDIQLGGKTYQGRNSLSLEHLFKKNHPRLNFNNWDFKRVVLHAKSKKGRAQANLTIGRFQSRSEFIDGNNYDFHNQGYFHQIPFEAPRGDRGAWKIHLDGAVKVKKITLVGSKIRNTRPTPPTRPTRPTRPTPPTRPTRPTPPTRPTRPQITVECGYVLETLWGKDIKKFRSSATGPASSDVRSRACIEAKNRCLHLSNEIPLTKCSKL